MQHVDWFEVLVDIVIGFVLLGTVGSCVAWIHAGLKEQVSGSPTPLPNSRSPR